MTAAERWRSRFGAVLREGGPMRVLIVGGNRVCHERLSRSGHELVLLHRRGRTLPADLTGLYHHVLAIADDAPDELWVEMAAAVYRVEPFEVVVALNEDGYREAAEIGRALDLPCVVDVELFDRVRDKATTRMVLDSVGIPSCRYLVARGPAALRAAVEDIGFPCIVKPVDASGSLGVSKVSTPADVQDACDRAGVERLERGMIVEEFLNGEEFSVEAVSVGRAHRIVAVTKKFVKEGNFIEQGHLVPAELSEGDRLEIEKYVLEVLDVLGFHDSPSHTELVLTPAGPRLIETHNRIGGDLIADLVGYATGLDLYDLVARQGIGEDIAPLLPAEIKAERHAAIWYADPDVPRDMHLTEVTGMEAALAVPHVVGVQVLAEPGPGRGEVSNSFDRSAWALAVASTGEVAVEHARQAIDALRFSYVWKRP